jgi:tetratricopeptide (TPR) repeat protein
MEGNRERARVLLELGNGAERSGDPGGALGWFDAAARSDPAFPDPVLRRCSLLRRLGREAEALDIAAALAAALPHVLAAHDESGLCLLALLRNAEAEMAFRHVLEADPGHLEAWKGLGVALGRLGRTDEAFACFDRAEGREPRAPAPELSPPRNPELVAAVHDHMFGLQELGRGFTHISADIQFTFKAAVAMLGFLLKDYDMDGVVVAVARPPQIYRQTLDRRVAAPHPPHYIELLAPGPGPAGPIPPPGPSGLAEGNPGAAAGDVTTLSAFEPGRVAVAVKAALQKVAARYGGEEHFVLMDDLAAMEYYNGEEVVRRFSAGFFGELSSLGIFSFLVLPDEKARLLGPAPFSSRGRLRIEGAWLAGV